MYSFGSVPPNLPLSSLSLIIFISGVSPLLVLGSPAKSLRLRACHSFWEFSYCAVFLPFLQSHSTFIRYPILGLLLVKSVHAVLSVPTFPAFHTLVLIFLRISKTPPSPCVSNIGRPRSPPGSLFGLPPSLNSQRLTRSIQPHSVTLHSVSFRLPHTRAIIP